MKQILSKALQYQKERKTKTEEEFNLLCEIVKKALGESPITQEQVTTALKKDVSTITALTKEIPKGDYLQLKSNKLSYLLRGATIVVQHHWRKIVDGSLTADVEKWGDTSLINYAQTALLETLSITRDDKKITEIPDLQKENIYVDGKSGNIWSIESRYINLPNPYQKCRWVANPLQNTSRLRLSIPHIAYWYGGSRYLPSSQENKFLPYDCSSWVAKLTEAAVPFSTTNILNIIDNPNSTGSYDQAARAVLQHVEEPAAGDIFCQKGHCGIVVQYDNPKEDAVNITGVSFARMMPGVEGCVETPYCYNPTTKQGKLDYSGVPKRLVQDFYGLDNPSSKFNGTFHDLFFFKSKDIYDNAPTVTQI